MQFAQRLVEGQLLRRYKRFLADVRLASGETITAHTANPGGMRGLDQPGSKVYLSHHPGRGRKLPYSWEIVRVGRWLVGVNPLLSNRLVEEAIARGVIRELRGYGAVRREVAYGTRGSRVDLVLERSRAPRQCYVEVKTSTLVDGDRSLFPDAVTARGLKHLHELRDMVGAGHRAMVCFVAPRGDVRSWSPADHIDPVYGAALREVVGQGVEVVAYRARVRRRGLSLVQRLPVVLSIRE